MATFNYVPDIFVNAVRQGDLDKVRDMLSERFYRYAECIDFDTREHVFILGASEGHIDIVKALVAAKTNIYVKSNSGKSAMDIAKTPAMIKYLKGLYAPEAEEADDDETMPATPGAGPLWHQLSGLSIYDGVEEAVKVKPDAEEATEEAEEKAEEAVKVKSEPDEEADEAEEADESEEAEADEEPGMVPNPDASKALMDLLHVPSKILELKFAPDNNMFMPIPVNVTKDVPGIHMKVMVRNEGVPPMLMNAVVLNNMYYVIVEAIEDSILVRKLHPCILA